MGMMDPSLIDSNVIDTLSQLINSDEFTELYNNQNEEDDDYSNQYMSGIDIPENTSELVNTNQILPNITSGLANTTNNELVNTNQILPNNTNDELGESLNNDDNNIDNNNMPTLVEPVTEVVEELTSPIPVAEQVIDEELEEYVDTFMKLLDNSPDLLGLLVQRQKNIAISTILASKLDNIDYDLALYVVQNNNKFFQRVYEIINGFDRGTTKRVDIFGSNRNSGNSIEQMFQSLMGGNVSIELPPPENPQPVVQQIQITTEQNIVLDRLSEIFPNTDRLVLYEALTVCDNNDELAINYLFDNN